MVTELTGDRTELLNRITVRHISGEAPPGDAVQAGIVKITNMAGEIFFLFSRLTREMSRCPAPAVPSPATPGE